MKIKLQNRSRYMLSRKDKFKIKFKGNVKKQKMDKHILTKHIVGKF